MDSRVAANMDAHNPHSGGAGMAQAAPVPLSASNMLREASVQFFGSSGALMTSMPMLFWGVPMSGNKEDDILYCGYPVILNPPSDSAAAVGASVKLKIAYIDLCKAVETYFTAMQQAGARKEEGASKIKSKRGRKTVG